jgi:CheY-like chemotaxis protein
MDQPAYETHTAGCEIWNERRSNGRDAGRGARRVLIAHAESNVGDSFALMLAMRGYEAVQVGNMPGALQFASEWQPHVLFVDTRMGCTEELHDHAMVRALREQARQLAWLEAQMMIAFAADEASDPRDTLLAAGYDGFVRTPCPVWRMFDLLRRYFAR